MESAKVAVVQDIPCFLDRSATVERTIQRLDEAAGEGARLVLFPEAFIPGYPDWVWRTRPWGDGSGDLYGRLLDESVELDSPSVDRLCEAARRTSTWVAVGINERDGSTLYNSLLYLSPEGEIAGVHRKLMPTGGERLVWGYGDGSGLIALDTPFGRVGGLICWENYMPLARAAMYALGIDLYLAPTWDNSDTWVPTLRHIAKEGRVFVLGTNSVLRGSDVPDALGAGDLYGGDDDWMSRGNAAIVSPEGDLLAGPLIEETGILYADIDAEVARRSRQQFDPVGHYARPDVLRLIVDEGARAAVSFPSRDGGGRDEAAVVPDAADSSRAG